ncbi:MAG: metallophosphoesterase [Chloroflexi bacterium]|nr:metallophosphoesterase [Chloroflexota bacterium]
MSAAVATPIRAVVTADNHLNRYYDRLSPPKLAERRKQLRRGFDRAVEAAIEQRADLFVQAGDLFDTPDPRNLDREFVAAQLARLRAAGVRAVGISGNHDTPKQRTEQGGYLPQGIYRQLGALHLLLDDGTAPTPTEVFEIRGQRVAVGALPWSSLRRAGDDPLADLAWAPEADLRLFLFHHSIEGHIFPGAPEPIVARASLDRLHGTQLVVAGHVHRHAHWQLGRTTVLVPGATEHTTFGETGPAGFSVVELSAGGVERLEHVPVACQPRRQVTVRTTELPDDGQDRVAAILRRLEEGCGPDVMARLILEGPIEREAYHALDFQRIWEVGLACCFSFDLDASGLFVQDEQGDRPAGGVRLSQRDELAACADALMEQADAEERVLLEETKQAILAFYEREESR